MALYLVNFTLLVLPVVARVLNVTIDDTLGDARTSQKPRYEAAAPPDWRARSVGGSPCQICTAQPDGTRIYNGTWHDKTTYIDEPDTISIDFNGTAIYLFCILPNGIYNTINTTRLSFYMDGSSTPVGHFLHELDATQGPYYGGPLWTKPRQNPAAFLFQHRR
ncbi:hypothetical protein AURDEDRAFT_175177 [Auricularia subglabra TFB-10046 SS5]|nr:hypothetical protein AURDEDRAFT_175177 [Auricularia subglabra TFB-10046 SS5]